MIIKDKTAFFSCNLTVCKVNAESENAAANTAKHVTISKGTFYTPGRDCTIVEHIVQWYIIQYVFYRCLKKKPKDD